MKKIQLYNHFTKEHIVHLNAGLIQWWQILSSLSNSCSLIILWIKSVKYSSFFIIYAANAAEDSSNVAANAAEDSAAADAEENSADAAKDSAAAAPAEAAPAAAEPAAKDSAAVADAAKDSAAAADAAEDSPEAANLVKDSADAAADVAADSAAGIACTGSRMNSSIESLSGIVTTELLSSSSVKLITTEDAGALQCVHNDLSVS